jgi:aerobic C4-dicarboxylate transport protein
MLAEMPVCIASLYLHGHRQQRACKCSILFVDQPSRMRFFKVLYVQVIIGIILGVLVGWLFPAFAPTAKLISETFINMIRMVIAPVIFLTIVSGIAGAGNMKKVGRVGLKSLIYFEVVTSLALVIGLITANVIRPGHGIARPASGARLLYPPRALISTGANSLPTSSRQTSWKHLPRVISCRCFSSASFSRSGSKLWAHAGEGLLAGMEKVNRVLFNVLKIVMKLSPIGAFGGMAYTIGKFGFATLAVLGKLLLTFYATGLLFIFVVLNLICRYYKISLIKLLSYIKEEILIVLGASSSEAVLPSLMQKLTAAGCRKEVVGLVVPTGYSFNLDGTTIYLSMSVIFLAQVFGIDLSIGQQCTVIGILLLTSKGAAGVAGSGFIVLTSTLAAIKVIPVEGVAMLIGVDRFMSEGRALINFIGNSIATVVIARSENELDIDQYREVVEGKMRPVQAGL